MQWQGRLVWRTHAPLATALAQQHALVGRQEGFGSRVACLQATVLGLVVAQLVAAVCPPSQLSLSLGFALLICQCGIVLVL